MFHHFDFGDDDTITCRRYVTSEEEVFRVRISDAPPHLPEIVTPNGLSLERAWYLYNSVRSLCSDPSKADAVAPKPNQEVRKKGAEDVKEPSITRKRAKVGEPSLVKKQASGEPSSSSTFAVTSTPIRSVRKGRSTKKQ